MNQVIVGIGSNINPKKNIEDAKSLIHKKFSVLAESKLVETEPIGYKNQENFINGVILIQTKSQQEELRSQLKEIENILGRIRTNNKNGPRTIDLDIVIWNNEVVDEDFYHRDFLRLAVQEVLPELKIY